MTGAMARRESVIEAPAASSFTGHKGLWMLNAVLDEGQSLSDQSQISVDEGRVAA